MNANPPPRPRPSPPIPAPAGFAAAGPIAAAVALLLTACPSASEPQSAARVPAKDGGKIQGPRQDAAITGPPAPGDNGPDHAARLADLDQLCAALDRDYVDGTLSDYYAKVEMQTAWGKKQRDLGSASVKPARELETAIREIDPRGTASALTHCHTLLAYIDDVE